MANIEAQIKPTGMSQRSLVDLLYMTVNSIYGLCAKLDSDAGVPSATYVANVYTAIFNGSISDGKGNNINNQVSTAVDRYFMITPTGLDNKALLECLYQIFDMIETLTEQLDGDSLTDTNYEALVYTAYFLWIIENCKGSQLGNGTAYYFRNASENRKELVNLLYAIVKAWDVLCAKLDDDGTVTDTDYEALCYTGSTGTYGIKLRVQDSAGNVIGNTITVTP